MGGTDSVESGGGVDWAAATSDLVKDFNAKQIAELTALFAAASEAEAKLSRCKRALEIVEFDADETPEDLRDRLAAFGPLWLRNAALALRPEVEAISLARRTPADKVMVFRARDLAHVRSVTVARFWLAGTSCTEKMEAMSNFVHSQLSAVLLRMLDGEIAPKHVMFVADKENCNKFLWGGNGGAP